MLRGKTVVITGCLRGIGRSTLDVFAQNGANIFACAQNEEDEFSAHIQELSAQYAVEITPVYFDLANSESIKSGMKQIISSKKKIDALINIADVTYNALYVMTSIDKMREVFEIDFFSQMLITQYISKLMLRQKSGSIVTVASIAGMDGNAGQIAYSAAKAAVIGATKTLAAELGAAGIRVNAVAPGVIKTDMTMALPDDIFSKLVSKADIPRAGEPDEVAKVLLYLASDLSSYVTGQVIRIDGGMGS
ncbi:MAG: SDR family oxidoreductase [Christensenella sp.]